MAAEKYVFGIKSVKFGTPTGTKTMPDAGDMTAWAQTVEGSLTLSEDEATTKPFKVEETSTPIKTIVTDSGALAIKWRAYDMSVKQVEKVKGGTGTEGIAGTAHSYEGPVQVVAQDLALEIETTNGVKWLIFNAAVVARFDGAISRESLLEMEVKASAQDPGDGTAPYKFELPNPA